MQVWRTETLQDYYEFLRDNAEEAQAPSAICSSR
jgi:hypothetical protein